MVQKIYTNLVILLISSLIFYACSDEKDYSVDVSDTDHNIHIYRLDQKLFEADTSKMDKVNQQLIEDLGDLYDFYVAQMVQSGSVYDPAVYLYLNRFVTDSTMKAVYQDIQNEFGDFSDTKIKVDSLFRHFKYYFPEDNFPDTLVVYNSVFTNGVISTPSQIGLGAEMYLGKDNKIIQLLPGQNFPQYFKDKMDVRYMVRDIAESWLISNYVQMAKKEDFLSYLIYHGKIQYALNLLLPKSSDAVKLRYEEDELKWLEEREEGIWKQLVDQQWVYTKENKIIRNFFNEAPFTNGLEEEAPAKAGVYMGKKIIEDYMLQNESLTLGELFKMEDHQKILKSYNPEK